MKKSLSTLFFGLSLIAPVAAQAVQSEAPSVAPTERRQADPQQFEKHKSAILGHLNAQLACVQAAQDPQALQACRQQDKQHGEGAGPERRPQEGARQGARPMR